FGSLEDEDADMQDAPEMESRQGGQSGEGGSDIESLAVKSERRQEGTPDSTGARKDRWNAINTAAAAQRPNSSHSGPPNGSLSSYYGTPASANASTPMSQPAQYHPTSYGMSSGPSPIMSPENQSMSIPSVATPHGLNQHAQTYGPTGSVIHGQPYPSPATSLPQQQQQQHHHVQKAQTRPAPEWTPAMNDNWLNSLDTGLGGDDVAAFVQGNDWEDFAAMVANTQPGSWLSMVWSNGAATGGGV
ncbi:hypothetical protein LTS18_013844, partial [Coniosporium uncinatum]